MYIPGHFADINREEIVRFIKRYSFGMVVSVQGGIPLATHLPFVVNENGQDIQLSSHFALANPQLEQIEGQTVMIVFCEPHAYISPRHYDADLSVPTWNYIAVHAYGRIRLIKEKDAVLASLDQMVGYYEQAYAVRWEDMPTDYKSKMAKGVVAFDFVVDYFSAINKLSQNKKSTERKRIIDALQHSPDGSAREIASLMQRNEEKLNGQ